VLSGECREDEGLIHLTVVETFEFVASLTPVRITLNFFVAHSFKNSANRISSLFQKTLARTLFIEA
jgi:hypothetical protein